MNRRTAKVLVAWVVAAHVYMAGSLAFGQEAPPLDKREKMSTDQWVEAQRTPQSIWFETRGAALLSAGIGAGLVIIGGARGISRVGASAVESIARQPEASDNIFMPMIITAAMIEGATLFAVVVTLLLALK